MIKKSHLLALALMVGVVSSTTAQAEVKNCAGEAVGGAIVGGVVGGILGGILFNDPGAGAAIGAGTGGIGGAAVCQSSDQALTIVVERDRGQRERWRNNDREYGYDEVVDIGEYYYKNRWQKQCKVVESYSCYETGRGRKKREVCELEDTNVHCKRIGWIRGFRERNFESYDRRR